MTKRTLFVGLFGLMFLMFSTLYAQSQEITVRGIVTDALTNESIPGVAVTVQGTTQGTITDIEGKYEIRLSDPNSFLQFSSVGFLTETVSVGGRTSIDVSLVEDIQELDAVVVVGYGTQRKRDLTGAVSVVNVDNLEKLTGHSISKTLQGQVSGVQVQGSGEPGAVPRVKIRGIGSFGDTEPLYVIDGVPIANFTSVNTGQYGGSDGRSGGIGDLNPSDIESVQILKDASAAAIYGSRGANGVIIITTKRGKEGDLRVNYEGSYGWENIVNRYDLTNRVQYQELNNLARQNVGQGLARGNNPDMPEFIDNIDTDWQEELFETGHITDHLFSLSGGTSSSRYFASLNYFDQSGTMAGPPPHYTRYSIRVNADQQKGRFKFGQSVYYGYSNQIRLSGSQWDTPIVLALIPIPTVPVYDENNKGGFGGGITRVHNQIVGNQIAQNHLRKINTERYRMLATIYGDLEIINGLNYRVNLSYDRSDWLNHEFVPEYNIGDRHTNAIPFLNQWRGENPYMIMEHTLTYSKIFGKHNVTILGGYTAQSDYFEDIHGYAEGYQEPYLEVLYAGDPDTRFTNGVKYEHTMISYLGRVNYSFDDRYFTTVNFRRDYSSRFGAGNKFGDFPSVSLGWKISSEDFFNVDFITNLMLRGGYGKIGNESIGDYLYEASINRNATYVFGGGLSTGGIQTNIIDPSIKWEERTTRSIGIDVAMIRNRLEFTAEYYENDANDILYASPVPLSTGTVANPTVNSTSMTNSGFEFSLSYRKGEGDFRYNISTNITTLKNVVTAIGTEDDPVLTGMSKTEVGGSMGQLYGWVFDGIFRDQDEIDDHAFQTAATSPGDVRFKDLNDDGVINDEDRKFHGNAFPTLTGGLNVNLEYKNFDFTMFFQGVYGNKIFNWPYRVISSLEHGNYSVESYENYWREDRPSTVWPRPVIGDPNGNNRVSDRWFQDGSYIRMQNLQFGYTIPSSVLSSLPGVENLRLYISAQNLLTITKYKGLDPDIINNGLFNRGDDPGSYPSARSFILGLKLSL